MIEKLKNDKSIDWYDYENGKKYGRLIRKVETPMEKDLPNGEHTKFTRNVWTPVEITDLREDGSQVRDLIPEQFRPGVYIKEEITEK